MAAGMNPIRHAFWVAGIILTSLLIALSLCGCVEPETELGDLTNSSLHNTTPTITSTPTPPEPAQITIKVVKFEPSRPCQSCIRLGNYAKETVELHFPEEYQAGKISYEAVNYQDPKNMDLLKKYGVSGSSLYITVVKDGEEEIIDANDMWQYIGNKEEYMKVFKIKLEGILNET